MTDDLVKRLRSLKDYGTVHEAADRIEKLEKMMAAQGKVSIKLAEYVDELEAALRKYADEEYNGYNADGAHARKALEAER